MCLKQVIKSTTLILKFQGPWRERIVKVKNREWERNSLRNALRIKLLCTSTYFQMFQKSVNILSSFQFHL